MLLLVILGIGCVSPFGRAGLVWAADDRAEIEQAIKNMLLAWQEGNLDELGKYVAEDVTVISGIYQPPLQGWQAYRTALQLQLANLRAVSFERENTLITVRGKTAWAAYQWRFAAIQQGQPIGALGHSTLILEKRGKRWLIRLNHTSVATVPPPATPRPQPPTPPA
jgi:ketosteroid isomerase-like protein